MVPSLSSPRFKLPLLSLLMLASLCWAAACRGPDQALAKLPESTATSAQRVVRTTALRHTLDRDELRATGTTAARSTTKIMPLVPGIVTSIPVQEGDRVKKGQVLAVLDQRSYRLTLRQAQAGLEQVTVMLDATRREKERFAKLWQQKAVNRAQYDMVLDKFKGAQVGVKQAKVGLDMARKAMTDTVLRSPYDGVVHKRLASLGDYAASMPPTVLVMLMQISTLELRISLPEPDLPRVARGTPVVARFPSLDREVKAKVARISRSVNPVTRSFEAIVEIDNADLSLRPGLFARVRVHASKPRRRLLVAEEAVVDEGGGVFCVFVLDGGKARRKEVRAATAGKGKIEIISGLNGTEQLILDASGLLDGDPVTAGKTAK